VGDGPLLVCYDGSDGARAALEAAAKQLDHGEAIVACYWQPFAESAKRFAVNILELVQDPASVNAREEELAQRVADEGEAFARELGLDAEGRAVRIDSPIDEAILAHAEEIDAAGIVLGARSRSSIRSLILGDVANEVVQRATRPVFVVPSKDLARRRRVELTRDDADARDDAARNAGRAV
jgi:nucleotide-binding universal stress UspA family protein